MPVIFHNSIANICKGGKMNDHGINATGGCLCGAVKYQIRGGLRGIVNCHCSKCRRFHGHFGAYTSVDFDDIEIIHDGDLKWFRSTTDETPNVYRGFCTECGSSLFWHPKDQKTISVAAGSLDEPTGLKTIGHVWTSQMGDYYEILDGNPKFDKSWQK
jgi:hypothetical protein